MDIMLLLASALLKLVYAFVALLLVWRVLIALDRSTGRNARAALDTIESNPMATAIYKGLRILAVCILVAAAIN